MCFFCFINYSASEIKEALENKKKSKLPTTCEADKESEFTFETRNPELFLKTLYFFR